MIRRASAIVGDAGPVPVGGFTVGSDGTGAFTASVSTATAGATLALTREPAQRISPIDAEPRIDVGLAWDQDSVIVRPLTRLGLHVSSDGADIPVGERGPRMPHANYEPGVRGVPGLPPPAVHGPSRSHDPVPAGGRHRGR